MRSSSGRKGILIRIISLSLIVGFGLSCGLAQGALAADLKPYKFGQILAMTGAGSWYGTTMSRGAELAAEEVNANGGVCGFKLVPVVEDHKSGDTSAGQSAARKLINLDKVPFIEGSYGSICTSIQPICAENKIVLVNGGGTAPTLMNKKYLHNTRLLGDQCAISVLRYLWNTGCRTLATIYYNQESGITINKAATDAWKKWGGKVLEQALVSTGQTSFIGEVSRIKNLKPDCIGIWSYGTDVGYTLKDIRRLGINVPVCGVEFTPGAAAVGGKAFEGFLIGLDYFDPNVDYPLTQKFVKHFYKKYGKDAKLDYYCANYYDLTLMLAELINRVCKEGKDPTKGENLEAAIQKNPYFDSVYGGKMELKKDGSVSKPICIFAIKDGKQVIVDRLGKK